MLGTSATLSLEFEPSSGIAGSEGCVSLPDMDKTLPETVLPTDAPTDSVLKLSKSEIRYRLILIGVKWYLIYFALP